MVRHDDECPHIACYNHNRLNKGFDRKLPVGHTSKQKPEKNPMDTTAGTFGTITTKTYLLTQTSALILLVIIIMGLKVVRQPR